MQKQSEREKTIMGTHKTATQKNYTKENKATPSDILDNAISFRARYDAKGLNLNKLHGKKGDK